MRQDQLNFCSNCGSPARARSSVFAGEMGEAFKVGPWSSAAIYPYARARSIPLPCRICAARSSA